MSQTNDSLYRGEAIEAIIHQMGSVLRESLEEMAEGDAWASLWKDRIVVYLEDFDWEFTWDDLADKVDFTDDIDGIVNGLRGCADRIDARRDELKRQGEEREKMEADAEAQWKARQEREARMSERGNLKAEEHLSERTWSIVKQTGWTTRGEFSSGVESGTLDPTREYRYGGVPGYDQECHDEILKWLKATN